MNKVGKVIASKKYYDKNRIAYSVTNINKYGTFTSIVRPCDADMDNLSDWIGYHLCERKNYIKTIHRKMQLMYNRAIGIENAYNALKEKYSSREDNNNDEFLNDLHYQLYIAQREYEEVKKQYIYMRDDYHNYADRIIKKHTEDKMRAEEMRAKADMR